VKWVEFFSNQNEDKDPDTEPERKPEIFRTEKSNLPANTSNAVKTFLSSVKSDITGSIYNKTRSNISKDETEALKTLVKIQRNCIIVIKPCDIGAGIIIVDHTRYVTFFGKNVGAEEMVESVLARVGEWKEGEGERG
jgi:hypothetical protein